MRAPLALALAAALCIGGTLVTASSAEAPARARAVAVVVGGTLGIDGDAFAEGDDYQRRESQVELPGIRVERGEATVRTTRREGDAQARAVAVARSISLLDGLVRADGVRRVATADGVSEKPRFAGRVRGLRIAGEQIGDLTEKRSFDLPDHSGRVAVNHGTPGLRILLRRAYSGYPAGTDIRIASVEVEARDGAAPPAPQVEPELPALTPTPSVEASEKKSKPRRAKRRKAPSVKQRLTRGGFAFPVFGEASVADDWGAPRAKIGAHQGNDIFAPFGAPVLAVADGEVYKVGTLPISGNRLWLRSKGGDEFFYAHLSAFAPAAVDGRRVKAGTVLGFTGNTGDAEPTPPHVHFEIHPGGGDAIDPHAILTSWQNHEDVAPGAWLQRYGEDTAERPGALVEVRDFIAGE